MNGTRKAGSAGPALLYCSHTKLALASWTHARWRDTDARDAHLIRLASEQGKKKSEKMTVSQPQFRGLQADQ